MSSSHRKTPPSCNWSRRRRTSSTRTTHPRGRTPSRRPEFSRARSVEPRLRSRSCRSSIRSSTSTETWAATTRAGAARARSSSAVTACDGDSRGGRGPDGEPRRRAPGAVVARRMRRRVRRRRGRRHARGAAGRRRRAHRPLVLPARHRPAACGVLMGHPPRRLTAARRARRHRDCLAAQAAAAIRRGAVDGVRRCNRGAHGWAQVGVPPLTSGVRRPGARPEILLVPERACVRGVRGVPAARDPAHCQSQRPCAVVGDRRCLRAGDARCRDTSSASRALPVRRRRGNRDRPRRRRRRDPGPAVVRPPFVAASSTIASWPRSPARRSTSSSMSSGPSLPGSVTTFDPDGLGARQAELEQAMGASGFWDDQAEAARISTEHARATRKLERYQRLRREYDDARELYELDPDLAEDVETQLVPLRDELANLQEDALFNGQYDAGDAVLTINAGTGGTDAQDWAEMVLRMYQRWAADRGFAMELIEASPGEEAGLKSVTVTVKGENAYGVLKAERGVHRLVRMSPFDAAHRRHTAFSQVV